MQEVKPDTIGIGVDDTYKGLSSIVEYTNDDGDLTKTNCGQAAAAVLINHYSNELQSESMKRSELVRDLEKEYPPNIMFGAWGTSPTQLVKMLGSHNLKVGKIQGYVEFKELLKDKLPVVVLVGVPYKEFLHLQIREPHWMVAYGFDKDNLYLTNWGKMLWKDFYLGWEDPLIRLVGMAGTGFFIGG